MRILLTEVTGGLGRALAQSLLAAGYDVAGVAQRGHRDLDPAVEFVATSPGHGAFYRLAADADVVVPLPRDADGTRPADLLRICDAATRGGARIVFPTLSLLDPAVWKPADNLVATGWAPNLIVRLAMPVGRQADAMVCRSVATLLTATTAGVVSVVHVDDLIRFLVTAVGSDRTGTVDLAAPEATTSVSARRALGAVDPRPKVRSVPAWPVSAPALDLGPLRDDWCFACGWSAAEAVADTARGLQGRKPGAHGAVPVSGRIPLPLSMIPRSTGPAGAAPEGAEGEFDDRIDPRFPVFVAAPVRGPLTPMSLDLHTSGMRAGARAVAGLLDLPPSIAGEWDRRLVAVFGNRIYLNASVLSAAEAHVPARAAELSSRLRAGAGPAPLGNPKAARRWLRPATEAVSMGRMMAAARMIGRHLEAYTAAATGEHLDDTALKALGDAQLDARIRLLRSRIHEGWLLSALAVLLVEVVPGQVTGGAELIRTRSELNSLARVLRAHPYVRGAVDTGDLDAARSAAPMVGAAFDAVLAHIGHRGPDGIELASAVIADRPAAVLAAAERPVRGAAPDQSAPAHRAVAYDTTLRFTHQLRSAIRELARRRVEEDKLAAAEDVFLLTVEEALAMPPDARLRVKRRAAERDRLQALTMPPVIDGTWAAVPDPAPARTGDCLPGHPSGAGVVEGVIRVVGPADGAELQPGDIAVLAAADLDIVAVLGTPAAVVTDDGPGWDDPAVIATELGVPVLAGVRDARTRLVTGTRARLDTAAGTLTVLAAEDDDVRAQV